APKEETTTKHTEYTESREEQKERRSELPSCRRVALCLCSVCFVCSVVVSSSEWAGTRPGTSPGRHELYGKDFRLMIRVRMTWLALVALALAWTAPAGAASLAGLRVAGNDADRWLVDDADFVVVVNMKQLAGAELMKKGGTENLNG